MEQIADSRRTQEDALVASELRQAIKQLVATLPRRLRDPLLLAGSGDYSYEEIAATLHIPVGTLKWRVSEARKVLKQKLAAKGFSNVEG
jgi:RNA polymerase sigma-70 factor (ECF subfamily)